MEPLRTVLLWLHVLAALLWIGSSACIAIAGVVAASNQEESSDLKRVIPRLNRLNFSAAIVVGSAGLLNLLLVARLRGFRLSLNFSAILALKVMLYLLMLSILVAALRSSGTSRAAINSALTAGLGILAMGLGIWLAGS